MPRPPRLKTLSVKDEYKHPALAECPNFSATGSVIGMRNKYGGYRNALLVRCGQYIYNVDEHPEIYAAAH